MMKQRIAALLTLVLMLTLVYDADAQCAMCKASIENGNKGLVQGVSSAIQYLMVFPYLILFTLGFLWYRVSKKNRNKTNRSAS